MVIVPLNLLNRADYELDVSQKGIIFRKTFLKPSSTAESHDVVLHWIPGMHGTHETRHAYIEPKSLWGRV